MSQTGQCSLLITSCGPQPLCAQGQFVLALRTRGFEWYYLWRLSHRFYLSCATMPCRVSGLLARREAAGDQEFGSHSQAVGRRYGTGILSRSKQ
jgi:hypothetical protein